jgi:hypothetical protein
MSFLISSNRLSILTQSRRLHKLKTREILSSSPSPTAAPYSCNLSSEAIQVALDAALAGTDYLSADWDEERKAFIDRLKEPEASWVDRYKPTVHAELVMAMAIVYLRLQQGYGTKNITIKGSHGKAYPGWSWPIPPARDEELRPSRALLKRIRQQLHSDFE